jgi:hypothetical protein
MRAAWTQNAALINPPARRGSFQETQQWKFFGRNLAQVGCDILCNRTTVSAQNAGHGRGKQSIGIPQADVCRSLVSKGMGYEQHTAAT